MIDSLHRVSTIGQLYTRFALAKSAAWLPAKRPNTAPFIKPDPPG
jgi:hypothetical protein